MRGRVWGRAWIISGVALGCAVAPPAEPPGAAPPLTGPVIPVEEPEDPPAPIVAEPAVPRNPHIGAIQFPPPLDGSPGSIEELPSGLIVERFVAGTGEPVGTGGTVGIHYTGWLTDGKRFDSSRDRGAPFAFAPGKGRVIDAFEEIVPTMRLGDYLRITVPPELAYGENGVGDIPPNSVTVYAIELVEIHPAPRGPDAFAGDPVRRIRWGKDYDIWVHAEGQGPAVVKGDTAVVHYVGRLSDGTVFDSSIERGMPIEFPLGAGRVIKGWDIGIEGMRVGELRTLFIPASLAYGSKERGKIPANSALTFTVELMRIEPGTGP